ncbi:hypothetical protein [Streptomyces sp. NPDC054797]
MKKNKAVTGVAAALVIAVGSVGCSATTVAEKAGDSAQTLVQALSRASDEASKAGSAEINMVVTSSETAGKPVQMKGVYTWGDGVAMETEMPAKDLQMEDLVADGTITMRMVQGAYYYGVDPSPDGPFKGKSWLKLDVSAVLGEQGAAGMKGANSDPTAGLKTLKYAKGVSKVGTESVNGKTTTHYRATVPGDKLGDAAAMYDKLGSTGGEVVTDVWVDDKGMPARMNQTFGTTSMNLDFLSFGSAKAISAPPAGDTADITELYKSGQAGGPA